MKKSSISRIRQLLMDVYVCCLKRGALWVFAAIFLLGMGISFSSYGDTLQCAGSVWNVGTIDDLTEVTNTFVLANTTDSPIIIDSVKTSCSCTTHKLDNPVVVPGKSVELSVAFNPKGRKGKVDKKVNIYIRGGSTPMVLAIKGKIVPVALISPKAVFVVGKPDAKFERKVSVVFSEPTSIDAIELKIGGVSVDIKELVARKSYVLLVHGVIPSAAGKSKLTIKTDNEKLGTFELPVYIKHLNR